MVSGINRPEPGKRRKRPVPFPALTQRASPSLVAAAATRNQQTVPVRIPQQIALKRPSSIIEVVFKNVFLKGAIESVESQLEGRAAPTDLGPGAPNKLWRVIVEGAEHEAKVSVFYLSLVKELKGICSPERFQTFGGCQWPGCYFPDLRHIRASQNSSRGKNRLGVEF